MTPKLGISRFSIIFTLGLLLSACEYSLAEDVLPPPGSELSAQDGAGEEDEAELLIEFPSRSINMSAGQMIFQRSCAPCHGVSGLGDGEQAGELPVAVPPIGDPDFSRDKSPVEWYEMVTLGNIDQFMPPFSGSLSADERWDVVGYVFSLSLQAADAEQLYLENCAACHGDMGAGSASFAAEAAVPLPDFSSLAMFGEESATNLYDRFKEKGQDAFHSDIELEEEEIWAIARQLQSFATGISTNEEPADLAEEETGIDNPSVDLNISGTVSNGSGGRLPIGERVVLRGFNQVEERYSQVAEVSEDGSIVFADIDAEDGLAFIVSLDYEGLSYFSNIINPSSALGGSQLDFEIVIYDSHQDTSELVIEAINIVVEFPFEDRVQIVQQVEISNSGEMAVAPVEGEPLLIYSLPDRAENLTFERGIMGDRYIPVEGGFGDIRAVLPGVASYQMLYAFELPYESQAAYEYVAPLQTKNIFVFLPSGSAALDEEGFQFLGEQSIEEASYLAYRYSSEIDAGTTAKIRISGRHPLAGGFLSLLVSDRGLMVGMAAFLGSLAVAVYVLRNRRVQRDSLQAQYDILDAIIALDEKFENKKLTESNYLKKRQRLKERLARLVYDRGSDD